MRPGSRRAQGGYVLWVILAVLAALVIGAWQYDVHRKQAKAQAAAQAALEEQQRQEAAERRRRDDERRQLEARLEQERKDKDALTVSAKAVDDLLQRWNDAVRVAETTGRISLAGPIERLQALRREASQLTVAPCMDVAKGHLVRSMDAMVEAFLTFSRNELKIGDTLARPFFDVATAQMSEFKEARKACPSGV